MNIETACIQMVLESNLHQVSARQTVQNIRNLLADMVIKLCPHPTTESVACDPCFYAAFAVRNLKNT